MKSIIEILKGGDLRSIGKSNDVVKFGSEHPDYLPELVDGIFLDSPVLRMRCADALEKVCRSISPAQIEKIKK